MTPATLMSGAPDEEVYLYNAQTHRLLCASSEPSSHRRRPPAQSPGRRVRGRTLGGKPGPAGQPSQLWREHRLAGSLPSPAFNITDARPLALYQPRDLLDNGRLFFNSPDDLVPAAENHTQDVYEYEPQDVGSCTSSAGCIGLISSGTATQESAFLDASESSENVFFLTAAQLVPADTDHGYDIYDAHACSPASPCPSSNTTSTEPCETAGECKGAFTPAGQAEAAPPTTITHAPEQPAKQSVQSSKASGKPRPPTQAQQLVRALERCRALHRRSRRTRVICERRARKTFAPKARHRSARGIRTRKHGSVLNGSGRA